MKSRGETGASLVYAQTLPTKILPYKSTRMAGFSLAFPEIVMMDG